MPGEIDRHHGVACLEGIELRVPVVGVAAPAVDQDHRRLAVPEDAVLEVHQIVRHDDARSFVGRCGAGRRGGGRGRLATLAAGREAERGDHQ